MHFPSTAFLSDIVVGPPSPSVRSTYADPALAFTLTVLIEWPLLAWLSRLGFRRTGLFCLLMNGITWGAAMGVLALWPVPVPVIEAGVIVAEAALLAGFWRWSWRRTLPISCALNLTSWLLGTALITLLVRMR